MNIPKIFTTKNPYENLSSHNSYAFIDLLQGPNDPLCKHFRSINSPRRQNQIHLKQINQRTQKVLLTEIFCTCLDRSKIFSLSLWFRIQRGSLLN